MSVPSKKVPQVENFTETYLERKNSWENQKDGYTQEIPHKFFGTVNQIFDSRHIVFGTVKKTVIQFIWLVTGNQNCVPPYNKMLFKIFGTLESFNFQNLEFLLS